METLLIDENLAESAIRGLVGPRRAPVRPGAELPPAAPPAGDPEAFGRLPYGGPLGTIASAFANSCRALQIDPRKDLLVKVPDVAGLVASTLSMEGLGALGRRGRPDPSRDGTAELRRALRATTARSADGPVLETATVLAVGLSLIREGLGRFRPADYPHELSPDMNNVWVMTVLARCLSILTADVAGVLTTLEPSRSGNFLIHWQQSAKSKSRILAEKLQDVCLRLITNLIHDHGISQNALPSLTKIRQLDRSADADLLAGCLYLQQWVEHGDWETISADQKRLVIEVGSAAMYQPLLETMDEVQAKEVWGKNQLAVFWRTASALAELLLPEWRGHCTARNGSESEFEFSQILEVQELFGAVTFERTEREIHLSIRTAGANTSQRRDACLHAIRAGIARMTDLEVRIDCDKEEDAISQGLTDALGRAFEMLRADSDRRAAAPPVSFLRRPFVTRITDEFEAQPAGQQQLFSEAVFAHMAHRILRPSVLVPSRSSVNRDGSVKDEVTKFIVAGLKRAIALAKGQR